MPQHFAKLNKLCLAKHHTDITKMKNEFLWILQIASYVATMCAGGYNKL